MKRVSSVTTLLRRKMERPGMQRRAGSHQFALRVRAINMAEASAVLSSITPLSIDPVQLYASLVDFSNYEPVALQPKPNTRSAAVTILIRFTRNGQVVDLNFLHGAKGITFDEDLVKAGTLRY